jgi:hypothetical protein
VRCQHWGNDLRDGNNVKDETMDNLQLSPKFGSPSHETGWDMDEVQRLDVSGSGTARLKI